MADFVGADEQAALWAARDADKAQTVSVAKPARRALFIQKIRAQQFYDDRQFVLIQLDDVRQLQRIVKNFGRIKFRPQIHVEDARGAAGDFLKKQTNGGSRLRRALSERTEADGVRGGRELLPFGSPFKEIPRDIFRDMKGGLASRVDIDFGGTGGVFRVELQEFATQTDSLQAAASGATKRVAADAAGDDPVIAEQARHVSEICGGAAEFLPLRQNIPKELAETDDVVRL